MFGLLRTWILPPSMWWTSCAFAISIKEYSYCVVNVSSYVTNICLIIKVTSPYESNLHHNENVTVGRFAFTTSEAAEFQPIAKCWHNSESWLKNWNYCQELGISCKETKDQGKILNFFISPEARNGNISTFTFI